jgi:hypothetical protein
MIHDGFEDDLRAVVRAGAPRQIPLALRERLAGVTATTSWREPWLLRGREVAAGLATAAIIVVALVTIVVVPRIAAPANSEMVAASSIVGSFVKQSDGLFGYEMLRPARWTAHDGGEIGRAYLDAKDASSAHLLLSVNNLQVTSTKYASSDTLFLQWEAFQRSSSLDGWTSEIERMMSHNGEQFALVETLPNSRIYATSYSDGSHAALVAYVIDGGQPVVIGLEGVGAHPSLASLDQLRSDGLLADFITMVKSVRTIPADARNVVPPLE